MPDLQAAPADAVLHAGGEELFDAAVLFTDMRGSSDLVTRTAPHEFFHLLNATLSAQAAVVRACGGEVVKYTGDGLLAVFRGASRAWQALRCATDLAREAGHELPFGLGVAEGPVLAGLVGPEGLHRQPDVVGAAVHLAARLCALADAGEVLTTSAVRDAASWREGVQDVGPMLVAGFPAPVACVALRG